MNRSDIRERRSEIGGDPDCALDFDGMQMREDVERWAEGSNLTI